MPISRINTMLFPGGKRKSLTLSYDDGVIQDRRLVATHALKHSALTGCGSAALKELIEDRVVLTEQFCTQESLFVQPQLFYLWGRSYEFDMSQNWDAMERFPAYVSNFRDSIWMAANMEIYNYVTAYERLVFSTCGARAHNPTDIGLWLESLGEIYQIPAGKTVMIK